MNASNTLFSLHIEQGREVVLQVKGSSMWPTIGSFEEVVVRPLERQPSLGEIVLLRNGSQMVVHRVIGRASGQQGFILTKGDNCRNSDQPVAQSNIVGLAIGIKKEEGVFIPWELRAPYSWIIALLSGLEEKGYRFAPYILRRTLYLSWRVQREWDCYKGRRLGKK